MPTEATFEDAFGDLYLGDETRSPYDDATEVILDMRNSTREFFNSYRQHPADSFQRPIFYRVVYSDTSPEPNGNLQSRLYPPPTFDTLNIFDLRTHIERHAILSNCNPTPFLSLTNDLLRALHIAFCTYRDKADVAILLICPWMLTAGSYITCNDLRSKCGLGRKAIYNTEILVWGEVPAKSVFCRWPRSEIYCSGLLDVFPSLGRLKPGMRLDDLRCRLRGDFPFFSSTKVASALVYLGMEPSHFQIKQVFIFLLGQAVGYAVEKVLGNVEAQLEATLLPVIEEFEQASHKLTVSAGKKKLLSYYKNDYATDIRTNCPLSDPWNLQAAATYKRRWKKLWSARIDDLFCPSFESWWVHREERDLSEWEMQLMIDFDRYGLRNWLSDSKNTRLSCFVGFENEIYGITEINSSALTPAATAALTPHA